MTAQWIVRREIGAQGKGIARTTSSRPRSRVERTKRALKIDKKIGERCLDPSSRMCPFPLLCKRRARASPHLGPAQSRRERSDPGEAEPEPEDQAADLDERSSNQRSDRRSPEDQIAGGIRPRRTRTVTVPLPDEDGNCSDRSVTVSWSDRSRSPESDHSWSWGAADTFDRN